jgi:hypothetical protein
MNKEHSNSEPLIPFPQAKRLNTTIMNLDSHKRTLAIMHLVVGFFRLFVFGGIALFFTFFKPFIENEILKEEGTDAIWVMDIISTFFFGIIIVAALVTALPSIIGGFAVQKGKEYGMVLLLISGCLSLLSFPIGTLLGAYTIWVFVENNKTKENGQIDG